MSHSSFNFFHHGGDDAEVAGVEAGIEDISLANPTNTKVEVESSSYQIASDQG